MKNKFREKNGVTMVALIITVVLLAILASVTVSVSKDSLIETKKYNFVSELEIIQQKILVINKEIELGSTTYDEIGTKYDDLEDTKKQMVREILGKNGITNYSKYIYMSVEDLSKIGLKNSKQDVIISRENSIVYSYDGVNLNGTMCYSIEEANKV